MAPKVVKSGDREIARSKSREIGILGDSDPGEGGYGNIYVTIREAVLTL